MEVLFCSHGDGEHHVMHRFFPTSKIYAYMFMKENGMQMNADIGMKRQSVPAHEKVCDLYTDIFLY